MNRFPLILTFLPALLASCTLHLPRQKPGEVVPRNEKWRHAPSWARASLRQEWWKGFGDSGLNSHLATALSRNPDLDILGKRLERAQAQTHQARAAGWPSIRIDSGLLLGREQSRVTGLSPMDLDPWANSASFSWELDLFGRIRAGTQAARQAEQAALWDLHGGRLL
ncbi:MAG TPA: hypothetical protein DD438_03320, partial [Verrucomicrobiales bacterium]|nr:hypothetical protein [Verrucomicrobiales bacterium]